MAKLEETSRSQTNEAAILGYEAQLWQMADTLRGSMDAAEYKHLVLGLIFLHACGSSDHPGCRDALPPGGWG